MLVSIECSSVVHSLVTGKQFHPDTFPDMSSTPSAGGSTLA
jgi:hypothetical protein